MNFLESGAFSFLAVIPVIIFFYLLKLRRKPVFVSSNFLWIKTIKDSRANAPLQKLKNNILLILQLLIILLLIFVKARPYINTSFTGGKYTVLILDNSASMKAKDTGKSRLSEAIRIGTELVEQMKANDQMMIITFNTRSNINIPFTQNKRKLTTLIKSITAVDTDTNIKDAIILAASSLKNYNDSKVILLSDGHFNVPSHLPDKLPPITFIPVGNGNDNGGITNINIKNNSFSPEETELMVELKNFSDKTKNFILEVYLNKKLINAHNITLKSNEQKWEIFEHINASSGIIRVKGNFNDSFSSDDEACAVISDKKNKILLISHGNVFLEHFLSLLPSTEVTKQSPENYKINEDIDITIFDKGTMKNIPAGNFIFLGTNIKSDSFNITGEVKAPQIISWDKEHPVMRFVDFSDIHIANAFKTTEPATGKILLEASKTPLIFTMIEENFKGLFFAFSLYDSDIVLRPAFPILLSNAIKWFASQNEEVSNIKTGTPIKISSSFIITNPEGKKVSLNENSEKEIVFSETFQSGIYTLQKGKEKKYIAVNLLNEIESDIKPVKTISINGNNIHGSKENAVIQKEFWKLLAIIAIIILLVEWYIFHKKVV